MERQFPKKEPWQAKAEAEFEFTNGQVVPVLIDVNKELLNHKGRVVVHQTHSEGSDEITYYQQNTVEKKVRANEPETGHMFQTFAVLAWSEVFDKVTGDCDYHEVIVDIDNHIDHVVKVYGGKLYQLDKDSVTIQISDNELKNKLDEAVRKCLSQPERTKLTDHMVKALRNYRHGI